MSIDTSLRSTSTLVRHKNVLNRSERIARLKEQERWEQVNKVLGMPKVANRKSKAGGKKKVKGEEAAAVGVAAPAAAAAKPAGGKAAGAKPGGAKGAGGK